MSRQQRRAAERGPRLPRATHSGRIGALDVAVHVLSDGRHVIEARDLVRTITEDPTAGDDIAPLVGAIPNAPAELTTAERIAFVVGGETRHGYDALVFVSLANAYVDACLSGHLAPDLHPIALRCDRITRALTRVGLEVADADTMTMLAHAATSTDAAS